MKALLLTASLGVALLCDSAASCRCAEQTLDEYFGAADEVAVGQLQTLRAVPGTDQVDLTFLVRGGALVHVRGLSGLSSVGGGPSSAGSSCRSASS